MNPGKGSRPIGKSIYTRQEVLMEQGFILGILTRE